MTAQAVLVGGTTAVDPAALGGVLVVLLPAGALAFGGLGSVVPALRSRLADLLAGDRSADARRGDVVEHMDEAAVVLTDGGRIDRVNPAAERLLGRSASALEGRPVADALPGLAAPLADAGGIAGADPSHGDGTTAEADPTSEEDDDRTVAGDPSSGEGPRIQDRDRNGSGDPTPDGGAIRAEVSLSGAEERRCAARYAPLQDGWVVTLRDVTDRARRRAELERYERVVEASGDPMYAVDGDGRFTFANEALGEMTGYDPGELLGRSGSLIVPEAEAEEVSALLEELLESDRTRETHETVIVTRDGRRIPVENHVAILPDGDEDFGGSAGVLRDISERKAREAELEQYETVVETVPDGVLVFDADGAIEKANHRAAAMLGRNQADVTGLTLDDFAEDGVVPAGVPETYDELVDLLTAPDTRTELGSFEFELTPRRGVERVCTLNVTLRDGPGFSGTVAVLHDVTDRKEYERDLERYKIIVETVGDPVYATDEAGRLTFVNQAFESVTGYDREAVDAGDLHLSDFVADGDVERVQEAAADLREADDRDRATVDVAGETRDGRRIPIEDRVALLPHEEGFSGTAGVFRDVSDRRRRQEVLSVMNRALRHNLRTNVNAIVGFADVVGSEVEDDELREYCAHIHDAGEWLADLGDTLRTLQDVVEERRDGTATLDAETLVEGVVEEVGYRHGVDVATDLTTDATLDAGPALRHALEHVVENAVVHNDRTAPGVTVRVREADTEGWVDVVVEDDGPGIPEEERAVVLGEAPTDQLTHGSGLGLWVTRWIVQVFDGRVRIEDNDPRGSVVTLRLRRAGAPERGGTLPDPLLEAADEEG